MSTDTARCELTELPPEQCACKQHCNLPDPLAVAKPAGRSGDGTPGPWFGALYDGRCSGCGTPIVGGSGQQIRADGDGGYQAANCCGED